VTFTDWLLSLHVLSAFALIAAMTVYWTLVLAGRSETLLPRATADAVARPANVIVIVGTLGTVVFGIWLAIDIDGYELWDGWILASLVLWALGTGLSQRSGVAFARVSAGAADADAAWRQAVRLHALGSLALLLVLVLMIWKPGA
jgi:uncharacterized membrane protein